MTNVLTPERFIDETINLGSFSFDVEHDPDLKFNMAKFCLHGVSFSNGNTTFYERDKVKSSFILNTLFPRDDIEAVAYNAKYDLICLVRDGQIDEIGYPINLADPMIATNLLDDNRRPSELSLESVVFDRYNYQMKSFKEVSKHGLDSTEFESYTCDDAFYEIKLWRDLKPLLEKEGLYKLFSRILMPSVKVFCDMERVGIKWDLKRSRELLRGFQIMREGLETEIKSEIGELNLNSGPQLAERLYSELGFSTKNINPTKSGKRLSVDAKAMDELAEKYPIAAKIRLYRTAAKMISTYVEPCSRLALNDPCNRVHPTFWLVSSTGRTRCEKPNLQNQPKLKRLLKDFPDYSEFAKLEIKSAFIAEDGWKLLCCDLSQIELRFIAHITQDPLFLRAYNHYQCTACGHEGDSIIILHSCPNCGAAENEDILNDPTIQGFWHGIDFHQKTADLVPALRGDRDAGKTSNFAVGYCAGAVKMHLEYPLFSVRQWQTVIDQYLEKYKLVKRWHLISEQLMHSGSPVTNVFGRKRRIPRHEVLRSAKHSLNQIVNFGPQAGACDYIMLAMTKIREEFIKAGDWLTSIRPVNFVHDEVVYEVRDGYESLDDRIIYHLEHAVQLRVPVRSSHSFCKNWSLAK